MNYNRREKTNVSGSILGGYVVRGGFYLLLFVVCASPFVLAQRQARPSRSSRWPTAPTAIATPRRGSGLDQSVAWQNNANHDGFDPASPVVHPLELKWSRDLSGSGVTTISYPLIAQGLVIVTTATGDNYGTTLMALDEHTGGTVWSVD